LLPTLGVASCANALVDKMTVARMTDALIVIFPSPSAYSWKYLSFRDPSQRHTEHRRPFADGCFTSIQMFANYDSRLSRFR
jgi:hypothetical protein